MNPKYERIEKYWEGLLRGEELAEFEQKMLEDASFAEEVSLYNEIEKSIAQRISSKDEVKKLRKTLSKIANETTTAEQPTKVIKMRSYTKWLVAASVALLVGLFMFQNDKPTYNDYAKHRAMDVTVRGNSNETLETIQKLFNDKNYELANTQLSRLADYYKDNAEIQLYYGITFLETDQYPMAKTTLEKIANGTSLYKYEANWYLALLALKQNDLDACKVYLERIPKDVDLSKKVNSLLKKL